MKKFLIPLALIALIFSSCKTSQLQSYQDDIYTNPSEEKKLAKIAADEKAKSEADIAAKKAADEIAQKAKDDANPYYQDPQYNQDDYYDYQYASKIRRFQNPVMGAGYYNNYYTNSYMYNQNPSMYGSSIYNSYNWWSPSNQFSNYSSGLSFCLSYGNSYGNGGYNPYGYNPYYTNSYYGCNNSYGGYNPYGYNPYGFNSFGNGYYNGYNNGFNNGYNWGYFNSYDVNSSYSKAEYGPRGSNGGSNSNRQTSAGMVVPDGEGSRMQYINAVSAQQENAPKFTDVPRRKVYNNSGTENVGNGQIISSDSNSPRSETLNNGNNSNSNPIKKEDGFWPRVFGNNQNTNAVPVKNANSDNPVRDGNSNPQKIKASSFENNNQNNTDNSNRTVNPGNSNNGGTSTPRGESGGSNRPR